MRTTILPGLLRSVALNFAQRRASGVGLFEIARVYEPADDQELAQEGLLLSAIMAGERAPQAWNEGARPWDFFAAKDILVSTLAGLRITDVTFAPREAMPFHPTRAANVATGERPVGILGEIHPDVCERFAVPQGAVAFELALAPVFAAMPGRPTVEELPRFPSMGFDLAVIVDRSVPAREVENVIRRAGSPELTSVRLFDLYKGPQVPPGKKSLAFALELRDPGRTLTDDDAAAVRSRIVDMLEQQLGAGLRA